MKLRFLGLMAVTTALLVSSTLAAAANPVPGASRQDRFCVGNCLVVQEAGNRVIATVIDKNGQVVSAATGSVLRTGFQSARKATAYIDLASLRMQGTSDKGSGYSIQAIAPTEQFPLPGGGMITVVHMAGYDIITVTDASGKVVSTNFMATGKVK